MDNVFAYTVCRYVIVYIIIATIIFKNVYIYKLYTQTRCIHTPRLCVFMHELKACIAVFEKSVSKARETCMNSLGKYYKKDYLVIDYTRIIVVS